MQPLNGQDQKAGDAATNDEPVDTIDVVVLDGKQKGPQ